jgi:cytochrome c oxidase cbb3-type subunit 3
MSTFWNIWVWILVVGNLVGVMWLLQAFTHARKEPKGEDTTGHSWDGDLREYNNPLPRWWLSLFWVTAVFFVAYLAFFPGMGSFAGVGGWSQAVQYESEVAAAEQKFGNVYAAFAGTAVPELVGNPDAVKLGRNIFLNRCATCHGSDGRGAKGFPNLTDAAWLWGGDPDSIAATIANGRTGVMPALGSALGDQGVEEVVAFLRALPTLPPQPATPPAAYTPGAAEPAAAPPVAEAAAVAPPAPALDPKVAAGQQKYLTFCIACHGADGKGNAALGAPDLTDGDWLHGASDADIRDVIMAGRVNQMPAQSDILTADRIHVLAAYVLSLGAGGGGGG